MDSERPRYGLLLSAVGAVTLAISIFLPWYGVGFTAAGLALAQQVGHEVAGQLPAGALQSHIAEAQAHLGGLAGRELGAVSAHQVLKRLNVVLLVIAGLGLVLALLPLARGGSALAGGSGVSGAGVQPAGGERSAIAWLGVVASLFVAYRMADPPSPAGSLISLSLREGAWLALLGALAMIAGALWSGVSVSTGDSARRAEGTLMELSGWTPET